MIHLTLPRDLVVPIWIGWWILGVWTSLPHPARRGDEDQIGQWLTARWLGTFPPRQYRGVERWRRGWTFVGATALAIALTVIIYRFGPYRWVLS